MAGLEPQKSSGQGFVQWTSNAELDRLEDEKILAERPETEALSNLATHIRQFFASARSAKLQIEQEMLRILRQIKGEYEPAKLQAIREMGGSDDFIRLTYHKCRDVEAWIDDILSSFGDRTWDIEAEAVAEIPPDVAQEITIQVRQSVLRAAVQEAQATGQPVDANTVIEQSKLQEAQVRSSVMQQAQAMAEDRATNMERKIMDQLYEGGWDKAFRACINDMTRFPSAILKGPIYRMESVPEWKEGPDGKWNVEITKKVVAKFERVSPFDWYPAASSIDVDDGDAVEIEHLTRADINKLLGVPGYKDDQIRAALKEYRDGLKESTPIDAERWELEKNESTGRYDSTSGKIDLINYWGKVQGQILLEWGMDESDIPDPDLDYQINAKMIGNYVIKAVLNPDPFGRKPYGVTSFIKSHDSQWGECPAQVMTDLQSICNASVRALVNNMAISSGPLTEMDIDRLAAGETPEVWPHKVIQTTNKRMMEGPAVRFYQANLLANDLLAIYDRFKREADDLVVPAFGHGSGQVGGAGKTSSGLSMLMSAANRTVKLAVSNVDTDFTIPSIERMFHHNMRFLDDDSIKGALTVKARGVSSLMVKEQMAMRRSELLAATLNPVDTQIMGLKGRAYLLGENVKALEMDIHRAMPNLDAIERTPAGQDQPGAPGTPGAPSEALPGMPPSFPGMPVPPTLPTQVQQGQPQMPIPGQQPGPATLDAAGNPAGGLANNLHQQGV